MRTSNNKKPGLNVKQLSKYSNIFYKKIFVDYLTPTIESSRFCNAI